MCCWLLTQHPIPSSLVVVVVARHHPFWCKRRIFRSFLFLAGRDGSVPKSFILSVEPSRWHALRRRVCEVEDFNLTNISRWNSILTHPKALSDQTIHPISHFTFNRLTTDTMKFATASALILAICGSTSAFSATPSANGASTALRATATETYTFTKSEEIFAEAKTVS